MKKAIFSLVIVMALIVMLLPAVSPPPVSGAPKVADVDFKQYANDDDEWINGILQASNSEYYECMSVPQRTILANIIPTPDGEHTYVFSHHATKGGKHAYDWLTAYNQGNDPPLVFDACGPQIGNTPDYTAICGNLHSSGYSILVDVPDDPFVSKDGSTQDRIDEYEAQFGNRQIKIYGDQPFAAADLTLSHTVSDGGDGGDSDIEYELTWTSSSTQILIEMAGHLALSGDPASNPIAWGLGMGSSYVSGGPYHFKLGELDRGSLGNQDNQIMGANIGSLLVNADITIHKTIGPDCPEETFRFEAWRDMNGDGIINAGDTLQGTVDITGAGTGVITVGILGKYIIHEVLEAGSVYAPHPDQLVFVTCDVHVYFYNVCEPPEFCELVILKTDTAGNPLGGACFTITPNPWTGTDSVTVCDNDSNDECPEDGVFCLTDLICELEAAVEETTVPDGYVGADPQIAVIGETLELTFVNTEEKCELTIYKEDGGGEPLAGACFTITPDPRTGVDSLVLCDNDSNDECAEDGVFCLTDLICELTVTIEETIVPDGYVGADPQIAVIGETVELTFVNTKPGPDICIEKLVDCNDDGEYLPRDVGYYGDTPSWYIRVRNCGNSSLFNVNVSDTNGMTWGPFDLDIGEEWEVTYDGDPIYETTTNTVGAIAEDGFGDEVDPVYASATNVIENGNGGGYSCSCCYECGLTVDWEGCITSKPLYCSNDKLAVDLLGPSFDLSHNLFLERGTHAPVVYTTTHYVIFVRELKETPATPENMEAIVVFNITPADATFDKDIFLTLGIPELSPNVLNVTMAYYDDVNGVWEPMDSEAGGPSGVAELTLSAPINHFSIYGVLAELESTTPQQPAHFVASGLDIEPTVEKLSAFVTKTGESVTITANVVNDGGQVDSYTVQLKLNGETVETKTVTLGAGQSEQVSFTVSGLDSGQYEVDVAGLSDEFTVSQTITWWLILVIIVAVGLIIWGVVWGTRRRHKAQQEA